MPSGLGEVEWSRGQGLPGVSDTGSGSLGMKFHWLHGQGGAGDRGLESPSVFRITCVVWLQQWVCWAGSGEAEAEMATGRDSLVQGWEIQTPGLVCSWGPFQGFQGQ